jgi:hypothetical protein
MYLLCGCKDKASYQVHSSNFDDVDDDVDYSKLSCKDFHETPGGDEGKTPDEPSKAGRRWYFGN